MAGGQPADKAGQRMAKRKAAAEKKRRKKRIQAGHEKDIKQILACVPATVKTVRIEGLNSTKDEMVEDILMSVLKGKNYDEIIELTQDAHDKLKGLGCFKTVEGVLDVHDADKNNHELALRFVVKEKPPWFWDLSTFTSENEGNVLASGGLRNVVGFNDRLVCNYSVGSRGSKRAEIKYKNPIGLLYDQVLETSLFYRKLPFSWSRLDFGELGTSIGTVLSPFPWLKQSVTWRLSWRNLKPANVKDQTKVAVGQPSSYVVDDSKLSFAAREMCGHSLSSSFLHKVVIDTRDDAVLPSRGLHVRLDQELAGLTGGDTFYFKSHGELSFHERLSKYFKGWNKHISGSVSVAAGFLTPMVTYHGRKADTVPTCDRFPLGGPLMLRGFGLNSIGINKDEAGLGGTSFWRSCLQLYFPLPLLRHQTSWLAENIKGHVFLEAGAVGQPISRSTLGAVQEAWVTRGMRASTGLGLVLKLGDRGRAELNYCVPLRRLGGDLAREGPQFGIGVNYS